MDLEHAEAGTVAAAARPGTRLRRGFVIGGAAFLAGISVAGAAAFIAVSLFDSSRPNLRIADVVDHTTPGFARTSVPEGGECGDRLGCVEGVVGDGVAVYRYLTLDLARQAVLFNDTDFYRSDRLVVEFAADGLPPDERFQVVQRLEGTWTGSSD